MNYIETNPTVMQGKPVIRGTRITVEHVLELLEAGKNLDYITSEYPTLKRDAVIAAVRYAKESVATEQAYPLVTTVN